MGIRRCEGGIVVNVVGLGSASGLRLARKSERRVRIPKYGVLNLDNF
jgi:hypothetical protein